MRGGEGPSIGKKDLVVVVVALQGGHFGAGEDFDAEILRSGGETIDDGRRAVGGGKHAAVGLGFEGDPLFLEPSDGVSGIKAGKGAVEAAVPAWVVFDQLARIEAIVSDVAAPSSRDAHFGEYFFGFLEDENALQSVLRSCDGTIEACGSSSDHDQLVMVFCDRELYSSDRMELQEAIELCLSLPETEETTPFGPDVLVYKVAGKMFATAALKQEQGRMNLKCEPERALLLREEWEAIEPGYHMNKTHWNTLIFDGSVPSQLVRELILHSYLRVVAGMPKKLRESIPGVDDLV